ncbi:pantetheine-phosphate adenylyltransferase [Fulvivirga ligni]|uniref:pantetheine-phosphate adenylyltransferase n=1 Tax=Fulvivirga ligni TaxID=2904246 RepID=UPI001F1E5E30|nr:pantetheine-phosphate adenylyltransferase [Fulvivirga ligni]UII23257.1 pantetheine-phosphate adenylyltransferase [Fulvivirga ligni]
MKKIAIFPGSFDPFTKGHEDIVLRGLTLFDEIIIGIGHNSKKNIRYFDIDVMVGLIEETFKDYDNIKVVVYNELTAELARKHGANYLLRGLRNTTDFEYENSIAQVNKYLYEHLESVFLITSPELAAISSSIIREVHKYGGDVSDFIPYPLPK